MVRALVEFCRGGLTGNVQVFPGYVGEFNYWREEAADREAAQLDDGYLYDLDETLLPDGVDPHDPSLDIADHPTAIRSATNLDSSVAAVTASLGLVSGLRGAGARRGGRVGRTGVFLAGVGAR